MTSGMAETSPATDLKQIDIDNYIKIWPVCLKASQKGDLEAITAAYSTVGWEQTYGDNIFDQINLAFLAAANPRAKDALLEAMPADIRPSGATIRLVEANVQKLQKVYGLP